MAASISNTVWPPAAAFIDVGRILTTGTGDIINANQLPHGFYYENTGGDSAVSGSQFHDNINVVDGNIFGFGGDDRIIASENSTVGSNIEGDDGNDYIQTGAGNDSIFGGPGDDRILAGGGDDIVNSGQGRDTVHGEAGNDWLDGGQEGHPDMLVGGTGQDVFIAEPKNDPKKGLINLDQPRDEHANEGDEVFTRDGNPWL